MLEGDPRTAVVMAKDRFSAAFPLAACLAVNFRVGLRLRLPRVVRISNDSRRAQWLSELRWLELAQRVSRLVWKVEARGASSRCAQLLDVVSESTRVREKYQSIPSAYSPVSGSCTVTTVCSWADWRHFNHSEAPWNNYPQPHESQVTLKFN